MSVQQEDSGQSLSAIESKIIQNIDIRYGDLRVHFANSDEEIETVQKLRYEIFNKELGIGFERSHEMCRDVSETDYICDHLLIEDQSVSRIIGCYRLYRIPITPIDSLEQYYKRSFVDMSVLPKDVLKHSVEVSRVCIHKSYRRQRVLYLLWRGIARYILALKKRYLFGYASFIGNTPEQVYAYWYQMMREGNVHSTYVLPVKSRFQAPQLEESQSNKDYHKLGGEVPQLVRLYLSIGAKVLSKPIVDHDFGTVDLFIMVDIEEIDKKILATYMR